MERSRTKGAAVAAAAAAVARNGGIVRNANGRFRQRSRKNNNNNSSKSKKKPSDHFQKILMPAVGMFFFYIVHDALQERMFRFPGFKYGWFMTLAEVTMMVFGGMATERVNLGYPPGGIRTVATSALIGFCVSGSHGLGNTALRFTTYPLKVAFKSCKLIPTMWLGICLTGRRHGWIEYLAASIMCGGLVFITLADESTSHVAVSSVTTTGAGTVATAVGGGRILSDTTDEEDGSATTLHFFGPALLAMSTCLDSVVPNLQEQLFKQTNVRTADLIFLSNAFMFLILLFYTAFTGEMQTAFGYCQQHTGVFLVLTLQATSAYLGLRCYLTVIREHGGVAGVLLANARKIVTIILSFVLFSKPCNAKHIGGLVLIFVGVYLGILAKKSKRETARKKLEADNDDADSIAGRGNGVVDDDDDDGHHHHRTGSVITRGGLNGIGQAGSVSVDNNDAMDIESNERNGIFHGRTKDSSS